MSGFWRPVSTLASLIGVFSGRITSDGRSQTMRSSVATPLGALAASGLARRRGGLAIVTRA